MSNMPQARIELRAVARDLRKSGHPDMAKRIFLISRKYLRRAKEISRAEAESVPLTPKLAKQIRAFWRSHKHWSQMRIAERFGVAAGAVSLALNYKVKDETD